MKDSKTSLKALEDYSTVVDFHSEIRSGGDITRVEALLREAKEELDETYTLYKKNCEKKEI